MGPVETLVVVAVVFCVLSLWLWLWLWLRGGPPETQGEDERAW